MATAPKFTTARTETLLDLRNNGRQSMDASYAPIKWALENGFVTMQSTSFSDMFELTDAGNEALSKHLGEEVKPIETYRSPGPSH